MLLDPLEEELDLPTASIQIGDRQSGQREVVGQEDQSLAGLWIFEADASQRRLETFVRVKSREHDGWTEVKSGGGSTGRGERRWAFRFALPRVTKKLPAS